MFAVLARAREKDLDFYLSNLVRMQLEVRRMAAFFETFDVLVTRYQARAYRLAWALLRDAEDARDLSQEAFVRLYETAGRFRGESRFSTWFYRILVNLCLDHRRRGRGWRRLRRRRGGEAPRAWTTRCDRQRRKTGRGCFGGRARRAMR